MSDVPDFRNAWRVVCPDGTTTEVYIDERDAEKRIRDHADWCDRMHDGAKCEGRHLVERAEWKAVVR